MLTKDAEKKRNETNLAEDKNLLTYCVVYVVGSYTISLRGNTCYLSDLDGSNRHCDRNDGKYFIIALLGKIKGEHNGRAHHIPCYNVKNSGINIKHSIRRLLEENKKLGQLFKITRNYAKNPN